jgi:hypothetical protein
VSYGIDLVKLDGDEAGEEGFVSVVNDATTLDNVGLFAKEPFGCPSDVVRMRAMIGVEDTREVRWVSVVGEEVVEIVGLRGRVWDFDDLEMDVLGC